MSVSRSLGLLSLLSNIIVSNGCKVSQGCDASLYNDEYFYDQGTSSMEPIFGNQIDTMSVDGNSLYVSFNIVLNEEYTTTWPNVFQVGNANEQRSPSVYFFPANSEPQRLHITLSSSSDEWGWDAGYNPTDILVIGQTYNIQIFSCDGTVEYYIDNTLMHTVTDMNIDDAIDVPLYVSGAWQDAAPATLSNLIIQPCYDDGDSNNGNTYTTTTCNKKKQCRKKPISDDYINCYGTKSCLSSTLDATQSIDCSGYKGCYNAQITSNSHVYCNGKESCNQATINSDDTVICSGSTSCLDTTINAITVWCSGDFACIVDDDTSTITADSIICNGNAGCYTSTLTNIETILLYGTSSLYQGTIEATNGNSINVYAYGWLSAENVTLICDSSSSITVECTEAANCDTIDSSQCSSATISTLLTTDKTKIDDVIGVPILPNINQNDDDNNDDDDENLEQFHLFESSSLEPRKINFGNFELDQTTVISLLAFFIIVATISFIINLYFVYYYRHQNKENFEYKIIN